MLATVISFLIYLLVIGLCFALVIWVLGMIGVPVPMRVIQILGAIVFLLVLLWFIQAVLAGGAGHMPRLL